MKTCMISFKVSESEKEKITAEAKKKDVPVSQIIREAIREHLSNKGD